MLDKEEQTQKAPKTGTETITVVAKQRQITVVEGSSDGDDPAGEEWDDKGESVGVVKDDEEKSEDED